MSDNSTLDTLKAQLGYLNSNGYRSYDLCDISSRPYFLRVNQVSHGRKWGKYLKYPHNVLIENFSPLLRSLYKVKKQDFAQSNAFIVRGLLQVFNHTDDEQYLNEAVGLIKRILQQKSSGYTHSAWGQPYDWFSGKIIPAFTPRTTVTSQVGRMFLEAFEVTQNIQHLDQAKDIGDFFLKEMPLSYDQDDETCYAYTTCDNHRVYNPNMMASAFLAKLWSITGEEKYLKRASSTAKFTFSRINEDGSWYYAFLPKGQTSKIDNYHTGYNIEAGMVLRKCIKTFPFSDELNRSVAFYEKNLFSKNGIPYLTVKKKLPVDIQCCAQSIITRSYLEELDGSQKEKAQNLFNWTVDNMYEHGSYYYRISKKGSKDKIDYVRWGDAWMFYAGSLLLTK